MPQHALLDVGIQLGQRIVEEQTFTGGKCNELYPTNAPPRMVAGNPEANDIIKCQLKPVAASDYKVTFTAAQQTRLAQVFPQGVCDWTKPSVGYAPLEGTWLKY